MYATDGDLALLLGASEAAALADPENTGAPVPGRLANALTLATGDINLLLGKHAARVASDQPDVLRAACVHIARWHLTGGGAIETDPITRRHKYYTDLLRDLGDGSIGAGAAGSGGAAQPAEAIVVQAAAPRRWGRVR